MSYRQQSVTLDLDTDVTHECSLHVTRDPNAVLHERLPVLIENGELEKAVGYSLNPESSHVMLCGNPQMVEDTKEALKRRGLTMNRRGEGNIAVENYW